MKISEAALAGAPMIDLPTTGEYFKNKNGKLCACLIGAAALGARLVTPYEALSNSWYGGTTGDFCDKLNGRLIKQWPELAGEDGGTGSPLWWAIVRLHDDEVDTKSIEASAAKLAAMGF